jgi:hypothetical protein
VDLRSKDALQVEGYFLDGFFLQARWPESGTMGDDEADAQIRNGVVGTVSRPKLGAACA